ncbi:MAG TPA: 2-amino-4-hydroxy-6-hydroxymethyldihydropteridine diphosphokinase, partial [Steroidobacteraceae bacterium]|nr:2-amino-4-hydroxy-6-hydroxymethyldihydropteridine diphosphokinase [Steroidobacteraceae bacterium]
LRHLPDTQLVLASPLYDSRPLGPAQPDFVNAAAGLLTLLEPRALLGQLQGLERAAGRPAGHEHWGPRVLDLDLLAFGGRTVREPDLVLPHPGVVARNFVLYPLADIAPDLVIPGLGRVAQLKQRVSAQGLWPLACGRRDRESHRAP